jgi:2-polyprenyl-3-methyl-5-hydroxy-6-metoxy-1,4-benzoquinol methylase
VECILCGKSDLRAAGRIDVADLCTVYAWSLGKGIEDEFRDLSSLDYVACGECGLKSFFPPVTGSPAFYDALSKKMESRYYQEDKSEYRFAGGFIAGDDRVLDIGCGRGLFSRHVAGTYTGLDFNPVALEQAARDGIRVLNESIDQHAGRLTSPYSVVTAFQVLEHMPEPRRFIEACLSVLRPGGLLILSVPSEDSFVSLLENAVLNMPPHHVSRWTDQALINLQNLFGLQLVAMEHEKLEEIHFETFIETMSRRMVRSVLHWNSDGLLEISFKKRVVDRLSRCVKPLIKKMHSDRAIWPYGHSVTAVYRKK